MTASPADNVVSLKRSPGRPKGVPNKATKEIRAIAAKHGRKAIRQLYQLMTTSENEATRMRAATELLDRGYGRPTQTTEVSGPDGAPIQSQQMTIDVSARIADVFASVAEQTDPANNLGGDELRAVQAINFLQASRDAAMATPTAGGSTTGSPPIPGAAPASLSQARQDDLVHTPETAPSPAEPVVLDVPETLEPGSELIVAGFTIRCRAPMREGLPVFLEVLGRNGSFLRNCTSVAKGLEFLRSRFPDTEGEAIETRMTPSAHHTAYRGADQRQPAAPPPQVITRRRR
jgi:hypothetical protein